MLESSEAIEILESEETFSLRIVKTAMTDTGDYTVKVANRLGEDTKSVPVTIKCKFIQARADFFS